jgi:hypothetical protein
MTICILLSYVLTSYEEMLSWSIKFIKGAVTVQQMQKKDLKITNFKINWSNGFREDFF